MLMGNCMNTIKHIRTQSFVLPKLLSVSPKFFFGIDNGEAVTYLF